MAIIICNSVPEMLGYIHEWVASGHTVHSYETMNALTVGYRTDDTFAQIDLTRIRAYYRVDDFEPYAAGLERWRADIKEALNSKRAPLIARPTVWERLMEDGND